MTPKEKEIFARLTENRMEIADAIDRPAMRGIKSSVIDKYSDQAHFIYELLQNADDAGATEAHFHLKKNELVFSHNGMRHFSLTDPANEDVDGETGSLGDINAITSVANSSKKASSQIGKFGVGFKAVFQYTETPMVYDPNFAFRIERLIVPSLLEKDHPERQPDETLFVFPFNKPDMPAATAYADIESKFEHLSYPILFLPHLQSITYRCGDTKGTYRETVEKELAENDLTARLIRFAWQQVDESTEDFIWLFSRKTAGDYQIAVAFFMSDDGNLTSKTAPAFCFFPTKEQTGLSFFIHAPFLLTDSREGIRAGSDHNKKMVRELAALAADALLMFTKISGNGQQNYITNDILDIIPCNRSKFMVVDERTQISFMPFYKQILELFQTEQVLPSSNGGYAFSRDAYWAESTRLPKLFSSRQLQQLTENPKASWVFDTHGAYGRYGHDDRLDYIKKIVHRSVQEDMLFEKLSPAFINAQPMTWLCQLYSYLNEQKTRYLAVKTLPVFLDQDKHPAAAFDDAGKELLFLRPADEDDSSGYSFVYSGLLRHTETKELAANLKMHEPFLGDEIQNKILPLYQQKGKTFDPRPHIRKFVHYYRECDTTARKNFLSQLRGIDFLYYEDENGNPHRTKPADAYTKNKNLECYFTFSGKPAIFISIDKYKEFVYQSDADLTLQNFFHDLNLDANLPKVIQASVPRKTAIDLHLSGWHSRKALCQESVRWVEETVDGFPEILSHIEQQYDKDAALLAWQILASIFRNRFAYAKDEKIFNCVCSYDVQNYYGIMVTRSVKATPGRLPAQLLDTAWIVDRTGTLFKPHQITRQAMSQAYHLEDGLSDRLLEYLGIINEPESNLTDDQKSKILLIDKLARAGITPEKLEQMLQKELARQHAEKQPTDEKPEDSPATMPAQPDATSEHAKGAENKIPIGTLPQEPSEAASGSDAPDSPTQPSEHHQTSPGPSPVTAQHTEKKQPAKTTKERRQAASRAGRTLRNLAKKELDTGDNDDDAPKSVDYATKIQRAKQRSEAELDQIAYAEDLQARALAAPRYSYGWFTTLLEMELFNATGGAEQPPISINFERIKREDGTQRTLVLEHPDHYIPRSMEELSDIPIELHFGDQTKKLMMEAANVQSYSLRVKLKSASELDGINLSAVTFVHIEAKSTDFLLKELYHAWTALNFDDKRNMQQDLCKNISFVFGPPGTGKTTYLAKQVLIPKMKADKKARVLVLAPTNKAADVLTMRIVNCMENDVSYRSWLCRFGTTQDETIEARGIFCDRELDISHFQRCTTVTTIARFPYDYFLVGDKRLMLREMDWDFIVVDEASMIPLIQMTYLLYKQHPRTFLIAGDPFQIEPITSVQLWRDENIYTMVHLDDFKEPHTIPHEYPVMRLTTQYRSIPQIGEVFSQATYNGILKHHRAADSRRPLLLDDAFDLRPLTIVKFPVSRYESIYRAKRLQGRTPYQIYAALFTFEFAGWLARLIHEHQPEATFRIGIVAPYRAQADLIDKLLAQGDLPNGIDVQAGTIHGFQGDECDAIIAVFNPPPKITSSPDMFLNKKNIINVAISRARDTLIVVMPNDQTENVEHLTRVKNVEHLMHASGDFIEYASQDIEQLMFGSRTYIEDNTFSTSHQSVNVYGLPETYYEIRSEDHALDVQIHKQNQQRPLAQSSSASANESTELTANVHGTKKISSGLRMKIAPDGWDQLEITLLVQFFLTLSKMDSGQLDQATKTFCDELQAYAARLHPGDRNAIAERSYDAVGSRIAGLNVLRLGASADEAGLPKLYEHVYHMSQAYPNAFRSWLHTAEKACPITW